MSDEVGWLPVLDTLRDAIVRLDASGAAVRQNAAADALAAALDRWPPEGAGHRWVAGLHLDVKRSADWVTVSELPPPDPGAPLVMVLGERGEVRYQNTAVSALGVALVGGVLPELVEEEEEEDLRLAIVGEVSELAFYLPTPAGPQLLIGAITDRRDDPAVGGLLLACHGGEQLQRAQLRIRELERRFLRMLEGIPAAVVIDGQDNQYTNAHARSLFEEIGVPIQDASRWLRRGTGVNVVGTADSYPSGRMPAARARRGEVCTADDIEIVHGSRQVVLEVSAAPVRSQSGEILYVVTTLRPITARRRLEQKLQRVGRLDAIGQLAGELAHDFNNFLHAIVSFSQLALDNISLEHPARTDIEEILHIAHRAGALTRQLLTVSRRQPMTLQPVSLNQTVTESASLLRRMVGDTVSVSVAIEPSVWSVLADPGMLERILINLSLNARDAMPEGGVIHIGTENVVHDDESAAAIPEARASTYVVLSVRDTGLGMPPAVLARIFEPFFTTKIAGQGTGLGLSMVYGVVRQMDGYIEVHSVPGEGTCFRVALPRATSGLTPIPEALPRSLGVEDASVLVIDDEPTVRSTIHRVLSLRGLRVQVAATAEEGLHLFRISPGQFDVIVIDIDLPDMNGVDLGARLLTIQPGARMLFVSGRPPDGTLPGRFISKPFTPDALTEAIRRSLRVRP